MITDNLSLQVQSMFKEQLRGLFGLSLDSANLRCARSAIWGHPQAAPTTAIACLLQQLSQSSTTAFWPFLTFCLVGLLTASACRFKILPKQTCWSFCFHNMLKPTKISKRWQTISANVSDHCTLLMSLMIWVPGKRPFLLHAGRISKQLLVRLFACASLLSP